MGVVLPDIVGGSLGEEALTVRDGGRAARLDLMFDDPPPRIAITILAKVSSE